MVFGVQAGRRRAGDGVAGRASKWLWWQGQTIWPPSNDVDGAALVGAHRVERLERAGRRLGHDGLGVGEDLAAADRDLRRRGAAGRAAARRLAEPTWPRGSARGRRGAGTPSRTRRRRRTRQHRGTRRRRPGTPRRVGSECVAGSVGEPLAVGERRVGGVGAARRLGGAGVRALGHAFLFRVVVLVDLVLRTVVLDVVFFAAAVVAPPRARPLAFVRAVACRRASRCADVGCARAVSALCAGRARRGRGLCRAGAGRAAGRRARGPLEDRLEEAAGVAGLDRRRRPRGCPRR